MKEQELIIMKFGGSSIDSAEGFHHAAGIIREYSQGYRLAVVVSAMYGVTDQLYAFIDDVNQMSRASWVAAYEKALALERLHAEINESMAGRPLASRIRYFGEYLQSYLTLKPYFRRGRWDLDPADEDFIASYGERLSYPLLYHALLMQGVNAAEVDPISIIATDNFYGHANVNLGLSQDRARRNLEPLLNRGFVPVMGGFYGLSAEGGVAVLGRDGSDYSAAILANVLNARRLILWKEVDGIYSADPKLDPAAEFYRHRDYEQAKALVINGGAKIIYPEAIDLLKVKSISIEIRNFRNPNVPGSLIDDSNRFEGR